MTTLALAESVALPSLAATGEVWLMARENAPAAAIRPTKPLGEGGADSPPGPNRPKLPIAGAQNGSMILH